jgi:hypothetical protein
MSPFYCRVKLKLARPPCLCATHSVRTLKAIKSPSYHLAQIALAVVLMVNALTRESLYSLTRKY